MQAQFRIVFIVFTSAILVSSVASGDDTMQSQKPVALKNGANSAVGGRTSILGSVKPDAPLPQRMPQKGQRDVDPNGLGLPATITLETLLANPKKFDGSLVILDGLYKIGTRAATVKVPDGSTLGLSLPVAWNDGRTICAADGKVKGYETALVVNEQVVTMLGRVLAKLRLRATINPVYKTIITASVSTLTVNNQSVEVVEIVGLEILGTFDLWKVAQRQFSQAFQVVKVTPDNASVDYGDGAMWVERLGGEQKFVLPLRQKIRDFQVRVKNDRDAAVVGAVMQRELAGVVRMQALVQDDYARRVASAFMGRQLFP